MWYFLNFGENDILTIFWKLYDNCITIYHQSIFWGLVLLHLRCFMFVVAIFVAFSLLHVFVTSSLLHLYCCIFVVVFLLMCLRCCVFVVVPPLLCLCCCVFVVVSSLLCLHCCDFVVWFLLSIFSCCSCLVPVSYGCIFIILVSSLPFLSHH